MNYTENYHLPQWDETDRIMRVDFNAAMADIEAGLNGNVAGAAADNAAAVAAAQRAQTTANQAVSAAAAAQTTANKAYSPSKKPYEIGSYTGTNAEQAITLGFRPRFVIIAGAKSNVSHQYALAAGELGTLVQFEITDSGFIVRRNTLDVGGREDLPWIVEKGTIYNYIAFR